MLRQKTVNILLFMPARIHIDVDLNNRLEFILEEYDYILKDEKDIRSMLEKIDNYVDRKDDFSWSSLIERSAPTYTFHKSMSNFPPFQLQVQRLGSSLQRCSWSFVITLQIRRNDEDFSFLYCAQD